MKICIAGWHFTAENLKTFNKINQRFEVFVVNHNVDKEYLLMESDLSYTTIPNIGLEFGCYDYYLKNVWDKKSNILFMHDDINIMDLNVFDDIDKILVDQAYIFNNDIEEKNNGGKHGRMIYMSKKILNFLLTCERECEESNTHIDNHNINNVLIGTGKYTGFWFDPNNIGHTTGKPPIGIRHYNQSIYIFHKDMGKIRDRKFNNDKMDVVNRLYFNSINLYKRGKAVY
jgi:hypothetical protein